jgi:beta-lactamase regulating signal transducer with metallopeptidase domain
MIVELTLITTFLTHHFILGALIFIVILTIFKLPLNISSEAKSRLWFVSYLLITLLPFMVFLSPVTSPDSSLPRNTISQSTQLLSVEVLPSKPLINAKDHNTYWHVPEAIIDNISPLLLILLALWMLGIIWRVLLLLNRLNNSRKLALTLTHSTEISLSDSKETATVWLSNQCSSPMVIGLLSPKIVLPTALFNKLNRQQIAHVVLHEQAHIDRRDLIANAIQEVIAITFWWSPIMRPFNKQLHLARELACDIRAADKTKDPIRYAQTLLDCAKLMFVKKENLLSMSLFSKQKDLSIRINGVINMGNSLVSWSFTSILSCLLLCIASISFVHFYSPKVDVPQLRLTAKLFLRQSAADSQLLIAAVAADRISVIKQLIDEGIDIDVAAIGDGTALIMAVRYNNVDMVKALIALGANVNQPSPGDGNPLIMATKMESLPMLRILLAAGANINNVVEGDETPLINASFQGNFPLVQFLITQGADVNLSVETTGYNGNELRSPLNRAKTEKIKVYLRRHGAKQ